MLRKHTSLLIGTSYFLLTFLLSVRSVCYKLDNVPFGYSNYFGCSDVVRSYWIVLIQISSLLFGYFIINAGKARKPIRLYPLNFKKVTFFFPIFLVIQVTIIVYFTLTLILGFEGYSNQDTNLPRILSSKFSIILVLFASFIAITSLNNKKNYLWSMYVIFFLAFIFAWFEGSRTSLIPVFSLALYYFGKKKWKNFLVSLFLIVFTFAFTHAARSSTQLDFLTFFSTMGDATNSLFSLTLSFSYLFEFSYLHVLYVLENFEGEFGLSDIIYSITPIPSGLLGGSYGLSNWRVDAARTFGGVASLLMYSNIAFSLFNVVLGILARRIDRTLNINLFIVAVTIYMFVLLASYQYNLRSVQWFIYLIFLITINRVPTMKNSTLIK